MTIRRFIFWIHLIAGLIAGVLILTMAVTGMLLAFEPQMTEYVERKVRFVKVPADESAQTLSPETILTKAAEAMPSSRPTGLTLNSDPATSAVVFFGREGGAWFVNPWTGEVLGKGSKFHDIMHFVEDIHRNLALKDKGKKVTGAANLFFLFLILSGLYIWWPRNWNMQSLKAVLFFNSSLRSRARDWNWHNVIGFWCLPLLLITVLTGAIMSYAWANNLLFKLAKSEPPPARMGGGPGGQGGRGADEGPKFDYKTIDFDAVGFELQSRVTEWKSVNFRFPAKPGAPLVLNIQEKPLGNLARRSALTLDSQTFEATKWEPFSEASLGKKLRSWVKPVHTGEAWGIPGQTLAFLAAAGAMMLVWTGFAMAYRRFFGKNKI